MNSIEPRIDAYIEKSADFAKPILSHLRELVHRACPGVEESWKWSFPHFDYRGSTLCSMAAFKQHCAFGFWKASLMKDPEGILKVKDKKAMGHFDRITSLQDLPKDDVLITYIKEAARLNEENIKLPLKQKAADKEIQVPQPLLDALQKNKKAQTAFDRFSASHKREYITWIMEAKTEATRNKRLETAIEWISEGKGRNWKYERK